MQTNKVFILDDPTDFIINREIWDKIKEAQSKISDYDNSRYNVLRTELEELIDLFKKFEDALSVHDLMKCEIYHDKIMLDHVLKNLKLLESVKDEFKSEFKSSIDKLCQDVLSHVEGGSDIESTIKTFISSINTNYKKFEQDFDYFDLCVLKHKLKNWIVVDMKHFNEQLRQSLIDLWLKLHHFEGIYMNLVSFMTAIVLFHDLIKVVY